MVTTLIKTAVLSVAIVMVASVVKIVVAPVVKVFTPVVERTVETIFIPMGTFQKKKKKWSKQWSH